MKIRVQHSGLIVVVFFLNEPLAECMIQELIRQWWSSLEIKELVSQLVEKEAAFLQLATIATKGWKL